MLQSQRNTRAFDASSRSKDPLYPAHTRMLGAIKCCENSKLPHLPLDPFTSLPPLLPSSSLDSSLPRSFVNRRRRTCLQGKMLSRRRNLVCLLIFIHIPHVSLDLPYIRRRNDRVPNLGMQHTWLDLIPSSCPRVTRLEVVAITFVIYPSPSSFQYTHSTHLCLPYHRLCLAVIPLCHNATVHGHGLTYTY